MAAIVHIRFLLAFDIEELLTVLAYCIEYVLTSPLLDIFAIFSIYFLYISSSSLI